MSTPSVPAEALLVINAGSAFLCAGPGGDACGAAGTGEGLYFSDTRILSELRLSLAGADPVLLSRSDERGHLAVVDATNPPILDTAGAQLPPNTLHLRRTLSIADSLYVSIELTSYYARAVTVPLELRLAADFADLFEVRGVHQRPSRGPAATGAEEGVVRFGYEGEDGLLRETLIELDPPAVTVHADGDEVRLVWELSLQAGELRRILVTVTPSAEQRQAARRSSQTALPEPDRQAGAWLAGCTRIETDNQLFQAFIAASVRDLHALSLPACGAAIPAAGIPWYVAPFGRDALITASECLLLSPQVARGTLLVLSRLQAQADDPWRDAEPGKIAHELRSGELARAGLIPHTPYYGTVDATPLFLMLVGAYFQWTADRELVSTLRPAIDAALHWIDHWGDLDGDGFVEYRRRSERGLDNQGWKDSPNSIVHRDGALAQGPVALVEVQGYVYSAKIKIAELYEALGEADRAGELRAQAQSLRSAFNEAFWNPEEDTFVLALDGRKRQVASVSSNPGHCLYCGIVDDDKAAALVDRLMAPDMFSGWGIRTLSSQSPAYNPMSYHNGSIWPHDNAIIAAGLKRYGYREQAARIATALFDVAARAPDHRLAELYCGFPRLPDSKIVRYPVACVPQAWAAAAGFMLLEALLGLAVDAPNATVTAIEPQLPVWLGRAELRGLRVGQAAVDLVFSQRDGVTALVPTAHGGELTVTMEAGAKTSRDQPPDG